MIVKDLMSTKVTFLKEDANFSAIAQEMITGNIGIVPICNDAGNLLGVITDRDLIVRMFNLPESVDTVTAKELMSACLTVLSPNEDIHKAAETFSEAKVHRLPVVENNKLVGMLSISDLAKKRIYLSEVGDILHSISTDKISNGKGSKLNKGNKK